MTKRYLVQFKDGKGLWQETGNITPNSFDYESQAETAAKELTRQGNFQYRAHDTRPSMVATTSKEPKRFVVQYRDLSLSVPGNWYPTLNNPGSYNTRSEAVDRAAALNEQNKNNKLEYRVHDRHTETVPVSDFFKEPKTVAIDTEAIERRVLANIATPKVEGYYNALKEHADLVFGPAPTYKQNAQGLTAAEEERLILLAEEAGEVVQAVAKVLRHGYSSTHPTYRTGTANRALLAEEVGHVAAVVRKMEELGDIAPILVSAARRKKNESVVKYLHHDSWKTRFGKPEPVSVLKSKADGPYSLFPPELLNKNVAKAADPWHRWGKTREDGRGGYAVCERCAQSDVYAGRESFCPKADTPTYGQQIAYAAKTHDNTPKSGVYLGSFTNEQKGF